MIKTAVFLAAALMSAAAPAATAAAPPVASAATVPDGSPSGTPPVDLVNVLTGTDSSFELSTGNTYPAIALPWGMNFWTPQTGKMGDGWQYTYGAHKIRGLKQTHQPSPWINDYGQFALMATTGQPTADQDQRASWFSHKGETATPYYYKVYLADWDVVAEVAPTERAAVVRFTFPETSDANIVIDAFDQGSQITVDQQSHRIMGYTVKNSGGVPQNFRNYFVMQFDRDISRISDFSKDGHAAVVVSMKTSRGEQVSVRVASSFISQEQALANLREVGDKTLEEVASQGRQRWNETLGRVEIESHDIDRLRTFYSCLYRSVLFPRSFFEYDNDGNAIHYSPYNGEVCPGYLFTDTGFWDTFRSLFPLVNLLYPEMGQKMQAGMANAYRESGFLPEWASPGHRGCMVGNNSASVVADGILKLNYMKASTIPAAISSTDIETLWQAVTHGAHAVHPEVSSTGRQGHEYYDKLGYVPCDVGINESAARTLEYAYDDWCIWQLGKALGKKVKELKPYEQKAKNYRNLFSKEFNLMRGRKQDGSWQTPYNPLKWGDVFTEGNGWHYTWSVFHDPEGLIQLMGGDDAFNQMMDSVFTLPPIFDESYYGQVIHEIREMQVMNMGNYAHGNQPIQHMIYLYNWSGQPWKAQQRIREVMNRFYTPAPDGYCGDEDNGQTSAWYVFSAMGFYPVCPATDQYAIGSPCFPKVILHRPDGSTTTITATHAEHPYIQGMTIDGQAATRTYLTHRQLTEGSPLITFQMGSQPNRQWGTALDARPYSMTNRQ